MAEAKQVPLNGAYYGPPVPPSKAYHSGGRRSSSCCCGPCCILTTLIKFLVSIIFIIGIALLVIWLVFRPNKIQVYVESATLTQFNLTGNNALDYNLALDVSIRNPNKHIGFYYDYVEARAMYDGNRFGFGTLPTFYQDHKNTTVLHPAFKGTAGALGAVAGTFGREKGEGNFYVQVKIYADVRLKVKFVKIGTFKPKYDCVVKLPVPSSKSVASSFERTKCDVDLF